MHLGPYGTLPQMEQRVSELEAAVKDLQAFEGLRLLPDSRYQAFSDGMHLVWPLGQPPRLWEFLGENHGRPVLMDSKHLSAVVRPTGFPAGFSFGTQHFFVGTAGQPVTLRNLVADVEYHLYQSWLWEDHKHRVPEKPCFTGLTVGWGGHAHVFTVWLSPFLTNAHNQRAYGRTGTEPQRDGLSPLEDPTKR